MNYLLAPPFEFLFWKCLFYFYLVPSLILFLATGLENLLHAVNYFEDQNAICFTSLITRLVVTEKCLPSKIQPFADILTYFMKTREGMAKWYYQYVSPVTALLRSEVHIFFLFEIENVCVCGVSE